MTAVDRVRVDSEANLRDILDKVHALQPRRHIDTQHFSSCCRRCTKDLLLKMGEKNSDGGQFFTPREVIRAMVHTVDPSHRPDGVRPVLWHRRFSGRGLRAHTQERWGGGHQHDIETLKHDTFYGREKENLVFPIALANLVLHGIDQPNLWHGNSLTRRATYGGLFEGAPNRSST